VERGPHKALDHVVMRAHDSPGRVQIDMLRVRTAQQ